VGAAVTACSGGGVALLHGGHDSRQLLVDRPNDLVADLDERGGGAAEVVGLGPRAPGFRSPIR
jgi:hypothetical protein